MFSGSAVNPVSQIHCANRTFSTSSRRRVAIIGHYTSFGVPNISGIERFQPAPAPCPRSDPEMGHEQPVLSLRSLNRELRMSIDTGRAKSEGVADAFGCQIHI